MEAGKQIGTLIDHRVDAQSANWFVLLVFKLEGGETINARIYLTDRAMGIARKSLKAVGFDVDKSPLDEIDGTGILHGNKAELDIEEEEYPAGSGQYKMRVKWVNAVPQPKDKATMKTLTEKLRAAKKREEPPEDIPF